MASNGSINEMSNGTTEQPGDFSGSSYEMFQVSGELGVYLMWMLLQGINKNLWWLAY